MAGTILNNTSYLSLAPTFVRQLTKEGFSYIGFYEIQYESVCKFTSIKKLEIGSFQFMRMSVMLMVASISGSENAKDR